MVKVFDIICRLFHRNMTRPVHGEYICLDCGRKYKSPFA